VQQAPETFITRNLEEMKSLAPRPVEPATPEYSPSSEDISPLKVKRVTITARNTPLGDVLHVIAEASGLNLMISRDVHLELPVTLTLRSVTCESALLAIFSTLDYSYGIRDNMLLVEATTTRIFELGHPALIQGYSLDIGGDILGGALAATASGSSSTTSTTSSSTTGSSGSSNIKGSVQQTARSDTRAFDFWSSLERSLNDMLRSTAGSEESATLTSPPQGGNPAPAGVAPAGEAPRQSVTVNRLTGTIVVTATRRNMAMVDSYLQTLKRVLNRQVLVEARIIEVQLTDSLKYGVDWSFLENMKSLGDVAAGFGSLTLPNSSLADVANAAAPLFRFGFNRSSFQLLLTALKEQGDVKTLSNPRINVMNGQSALLTVGRNFSYISRTTSTTTGSNPTTTTFNVETSSILSGMLLGIVPFINAQGEITLTITPIISDLINLDEKKIGSATDQITLSVPTVDLRELSTTVKMRDGEVVVIGGLISKRDKNVDEKVPLLGDIPWLGSLFTRKDRQETRSELVVVLQPFLVPNYEQPDRM
jgi:MSHA type pilus biogenesis protein MshL